MSTHFNESPAPNSPVSRSNGLSEENEPTYPRRKYNLEDFSQSAINRGQQEINYYISVTEEKIVEALRQVSVVVAKLASNGQVDLKALDNAIEEASKVAKEIAGPFPPGCSKPIPPLRLE